ncbi:hypothetical protein GCM10028862_07100 [Luteimonas pelagia]
MPSPLPEPGTGRRDARRAALLPLVVILALPATLVPTARAEAEVRRCVTPDGRTLYTDRRCDALGANPRTASPATPGVASTRLFRGGCARNFQDLMYELTTSIDSGDVNRLAALYHWPGMSSGPAERVMRRLDAIVQRPLVDVVPIQGAVADPAGASVDGNLYPQASVRAAPVGLRVEQTLANGTTPARTVFGLRRHMACWWIQL